MINAISKGREKKQLQMRNTRLLKPQKKKSTAYQTDLISAGSILVDHKQASRLVDHLQLAIDHDDQMKGKEL